MKIAHPPVSDRPAPGATDPVPPDRMERQLCALERLVELGMELAEVIQLQAVAAARADPTSPAAADLAVKFTRVARSVGQTAALSCQMMTQRQVASQPRAELDRRRRAAARAEEYRRKDKIRGTVERAVRAYAPPADVLNRLMQLDDRLEDPALQADIDIGRLSEVVIRLCDEFGVKANFKDWTDEECSYVDPGCDTEPPGEARSGRFDPPPGPTLTEIVMAEAAARRAEAAARVPQNAAPDPEKIDPLPD